MKVAIYTEDTYGPDFLRRLINKMRKERYTSKDLKVVKIALIKKCHNVRKVLAVIREVDRVLVLIDKENELEYDEHKLIWGHLKGLKESDRSKVVVVATEPCIEEWICKSLGLNFDRTGLDVNQKPDRVLKRKLGYEKHRLPDYVDKLDIDGLLRNSNSFKEFCAALR